MKNASKITLVLILMSAFALPGLAETYDGFNRSRWNTLVDGSGPVIRENNNRLEILIPADSAESPLTATFSGNLTSSCKLQGDFDVRVNYSLPDWPASNGVRIGLGLTQSSSWPVSPAAIERTSFSDHDVFPAGDVYLTHFGATLRSERTADMHGRLRLERVANIVTGYYFDPNLGDWQAITSSAFTTNDVAFWIGAWSHDYAFDDRDVKVAFDKVIVKSGTLTGECKN